MNQHVQMDVGSQGLRVGMLSGLRVVEVSDETAEYVGLLLAGLGAEVIKVERPGGSQSRRIGPFLDDVPGPERSLFFWAYNRGKKSVICDWETVDGATALLELIASADILLDGSEGKLSVALALDTHTLQAHFPGLIVARMVPFGDVGPWKNFRGSDLIHLALGGIMMNCGYDPDPSGKHDLPPIAPQFWQAYQIAGEQLLIGILGALIHRERTGEGQDVSLAVHDAVSKNTELDVMSWIMQCRPLYRQTCRHASAATDQAPTICYTKDGRWIMTGMNQDLAKLVPFLGRYGMAADLTVPRSEDRKAARRIPGSGKNDEAATHALEVVQRFIRSFTYENVPWREAQEAGLLWAPLRKPHESATDPHWLSRGTFADIEHPELKRSFRYPVSKWRSSATDWQPGMRAPRLGEHNGTAPAEPRRQRSTSPPEDSRQSLHGKPFPLQNIRILDFSWFLASAGGTRFLAALGAESLKVEWKDNPDTRLAAMAPIGGRAARADATAPLEGVSDPDMGGQFHNKNSGKRGLSLNIRLPEGLEIAKRLVAISDVVAEGFSPGVLERLGLGYDVMTSIKPDIIYVQQSGMGSHGQYGRLRTVGPVAAAFAGVSELSGLPEPAMPAGWGYSFLDWIGAYGFASAILGALYHRERTGEGQSIDSSQCEAGIFLTGLPILDWSAHGRPWARTGNQASVVKAAPHGAYRCRGDDRWIAIACFDEADWQSLIRVAGRDDWGADARFATFEARCAHQAALDATVNEWTQNEEAYDCMLRLQHAGVAAGVCQTAEDRCDSDPQLAALEWLTEVNGSKIGRWPVPEVPAKLSASPAYVGGPINRGAPCYGEDNAYVFCDLLGYSPAEVANLAAKGVI
jgi:crotonobetainyl-CoA:carnitine CoA-transferase CaiB-like acyl-CoA transferase